ncbi:MAG: hypothetical protein BWK79_05345 [Beggiatoa sp. IS2]|nr:MAG: hypothetical protein BWK79_05345 [Beggiatoa sp. IS2]
MLLRLNTPISELPPNGVITTATMEIVVLVANPTLENRLLSFKNPQYTRPRPKWAGEDWEAPISVAISVNGKTHEFYGDETELDSSRWPCNVKSPIWVTIKTWEPITISNSGWNVKYAIGEKCDSFVDGYQYAVVHAETPNGFYKKIGHDSLVPISY